MRKNFWPILSVIAFTSGCAQPLGSAASPLLSPRDLNGNAAAFDAKVVRVQGYVELAPEGHILYQSRELSDEFANGIKAGGLDPKPYVNDCLTIINPAFLYKRIDLVNHKTLVLKGRFDRNYMDGHRIDLGACPLATGIVVDEQDFLSRYAALLGQPGQK